MLDKLDSAFSSLLVGRDLDSNDPLPGFEGGRTISTTDKVRLKSIVNRTRDVVVKHLAGAGDADENGEVEDADIKDRNIDERKTAPDVEDTVKFEGFEDNDDDEYEAEDERRWNEVQISRVYERTISELGDVLGGPPIGIITDD